MKEQIKPPKVELSDEEIANPTDAEFKTLVIRMLTELVGYGHKIEEEVEAMQSEIKENVQGTNSDTKAPELKTMVWSRRKKERFNQNRMKKQEFKKNEERLRNLWDSLKHPNIRIMRVPEGEEQQREIANLFEQIMKENFCLLYHLTLPTSNTLCRSRWSPYH